MNKNFQTHKGEIYIWKNDSFLEIEKKKRRSFEKQEVEKKLQEDFPKSFITHLENGVPVLKNNIYKCISISHYKNLFAFYLSDFPVGIDIQKFKKKLSKGSYFFTNAKEAKLFSFTELNLHLIWSVKEAIYKKYKGKIKDFKREITVLEIDLKTKKIKAEFQNQIEELEFIKTAEFILVWV